MQRKLTILFCLLAMSFAFVACDKNIEGVPASKQISELNEGERENFCAYLGSSLEEMFTGDDFKESMCLSMAAAFAGFAGEDEDDQVASCEESFEECMAEDDDAEDFDTSEFCPSADELADCEATMEEVHACFTAMMAQQKEEAKKVTQYSCEELIKEGKLDEIQADESEEPEACKVLQEKCNILG